MTLYRTVLLADLARYVAAGWTDTGKRDYRPFSVEPLCLLEFCGDVAPRVEA
jgi:hypothetical protein